MLEDRFVLFADAVFENITCPRNMNASCGALSEIPVLRTSVKRSDTKSDAYSIFGEAEDML